MARSSGCTRCSSRSIVAFSPRSISGTRYASFDQKIAPLAVFQPTLPMCLKDAASAIDMALSIKVAN